MLSATFLIISMLGVARYAEYQICNVLLSRVVLSVVDNELHYVESNKC